jgi:predicted MFS family arabinose efflux permease
MANSILALNALNFFMADVRDGLGPFLGVYLQQQRWSPSEIGVVMTIGGLAGMAATTPLGALVDAIMAKRAVVIAAACAIIIGSLTLLYAPTFGITAAAQAINGVAGAAVGPAIAAITLGLVRQKGFPRQLGRNEAFNHAGNVTAALLAGIFGYVFGLGAVFAVMSAMAIFSIASISAIDPKEIDHREARGLSEKKDDKGSRFAVLLECRPLLIFGATLLLFHLGNAAMLPLLGQSLVAAGAGDPSAYTSATIVVAQLSMIPMALFAGWLAERRGYWVVLLLALVALPIRGVIAATVTGPIGLVPVQILDGVGAGLLGVATPGLTARILAGTGHVNAGLGAVMTMQGIGASLSATLGGVVAQYFGYPASFLALGAVAFLGLVLWVGMQSVTAESCGKAPA